METSTGASSSSVYGKRMQKKGKQVGKNNVVAEATRIKISDVLGQFRESTDEVYTFQENLSNRDRAEVHMLCRKLGMKSKSSGKGNERRVSVYKTKKYTNPIGKKENLTPFTFSEEGKYVLQDLFSRYPPDDGEMAELTDGNNSPRTNKVRVKRDDMFSKPSMSKSDITKKVESFAAKLEKNHNLKQINEVRYKLPIASFKDNITSTIESNQVVLISGETGCGKTTQVPQYILDSMWAKGESCKIICTQPRRISATSVAERISTERGENAGDTVGYKIRLESKGGKHSSIMFCTNGVLLRVLVSRGKNTSRKKEKDELSDITHIIVDEIHERDRYSDFMLTIIRDVLPLYPHLHLILMSATLDAERFSEYFGGCPIIRVPGFTYPVTTFYLEDVLSIVKSTSNNHLDGVIINDTHERAVLTEDYRFALDEAIDLALSNDEFNPLLELISSKGGPEVLNYQNSLTGVTPLMVFAGKGRISDICMLLSLNVDCNIQDNDKKTALDWAEQENQNEASEILKKHMEKAFATSSEKKVLLEKYLSNIEPELIDEVLIEKLLKKICTDSKDGAILVFLPGWDEINRTRERLTNSAFFKDSSKFLIISLHSMVPSFEQKKVFQRPPLGSRKIILSTNIAESSITIDDVVYVIDSGRMKEKNYDPYNNVSTLQSSWISKASAKQREGRAGRCQAGLCYHLYSKLRSSSLLDYQVPEIKRIPIEELCLQVKILDPKCKIEDFLRKTLDPPVFETIRNAIIVLQDIGALSLDEKLTELGEKIGCLPVHPLTSKMLLISILLNCLDPALTLACASDYRDPFTLPMLPQERNKASSAKAELASFYGGQGDQLAVIAAFDCWRSAKSKGQEARFCSQYFISSSTMNTLAQMRKQLQSELVRNGFIPEDTSQLSLNSREPGILHAVLVAGLYPMVGRLLPPLQGNKRAVVETSGGEKVRLHPHSINFKMIFKKFKNKPLIIYDEITRGDGGLHIRNCCVVGPLPMLLLATEIVAAPAENGDDESEDDDSDDECESDEEINDVSKIMSDPENTVKVIIDRWLPYESTALDVAQIYCLRERLSAAILFKVKYPGKVLPEILAASIYSIACILSSDGMLGISSPCENVDTITQMVGAAEISQSNYGQNSNNFLQSLVFQNTNARSSDHYQRGNSREGKGMKNWNHSPPYHSPLRRGGKNMGSGSRGEYFKRPREKEFL